MRLPPYVLWPLVTLVVLAVVTPFALDALGYRLQEVSIATDTVLDFADNPAPVFAAPAVPEVPDRDTTEAVPPGPAGDESAESVDATGAVRNIILLIGDGMGFSQLAAGRYATVGPNGRLAFDRFPVTGWSYTHSAEDLYTDSAAGATALATGEKTLPGYVSVDADGTPLTTIAEQAVAAGWSIGLVTDSALLDATPSAFVAHSETRRDYLAITADMVESGALVLLGETRQGIEEDAGWPPLLDRFAERGYTLARTAADLAAAPADAPLLGLFPEGSVSEPSEAPSLLDLANTALDRLSADPDGFFLMVETEETDTYSHRNEFERMVAGVVALDQIAARMVDFARADGNTLVLVTADHDTGGLTVLGGAPGEPIDVRWSTHGHTAEPVPLLAFGAAAERFQGIHDNTEIGRLMQQVAGFEVAMPEAAPASDTEASEGREGTKTLDG